MSDKYTYNEEILDNLAELHKYYTEKHSKALVIRFDLTYPEDYTPKSDDERPNDNVSKSISQVIRTLDNKGLDPKYMWTREQRSSKHPHYHAVLYLDGQKVRNYNHIFKLVEKEWEKAIGQSASGLVERCISTTNKDYNGKMIRRDAGEEKYKERIQEVFDQVTYIAKARDKTTEKDGQRNFGMSRLG